MKGKISIVDLLVLNSLGRLLLVLFTFYETSYFNEEINRTEPYPLVSIPWFYHTN
jgi:hypothetical protein